MYSKPNQVVRLKRWRKKEQKFYSLKINVYVALAGELTYQKRLPATWKVEILDQGPIIRIFCTMQLLL